MQHRDRRAARSKPAAGEPAITSLRVPGMLIPRASVASRIMEGRQTIKQNIAGAVKMLAVATMTLGTVLLTAGPAAAYNDTFSVTTFGCNGDPDRSAADAWFRDYGPGAPGGGNNDDYIEAYDNCADGHGVRVYAWLDGTFLGSGYWGGGANGGFAVFDPFPKGNVKGGQVVGLKVCLVDGRDDTTPFNCASYEELVSDG
jgi:hypothetical protein